MLAREIARHLASLGIGRFEENSPGGDIFIDHVPPDPDSLIAVNDVPGFAGDFKFAYDHPSFQVWVRDPDMRTAKARALQVYDALHALGMTQLGDYFVVWIMAVTTPGRVGPDANGRHEYSINFNTEVKALVAGNRQ